MNEYLKRATTRGTQIRRRRYLTQMALAVLAVCAIIIPLSVLGRNSHASSGDSASISAGLVEQRVVPRINLSNAKYPIEIGCGPGFPGMFSIDVQQVAGIGQSARRPAR